MCCVFLLQLANLDAQGKIKAKRTLKLCIRQASKEARSTFESYILLYIWMPGMWLDLGMMDRVHTSSLVNNVLVQPLTATKLSISRKDRTKSLS